MSNDALQDTLPRAVAGQGSADNMDAYLLQMAVNAANDQYRRDHGLLAEGDIDALFNIEDEWADPGRIAAARAEARGLEDTIRGLTARQHAILVSAQVDGGMNREISERLEISRTLVEKDLRHAMLVCDNGMSPPAVADKFERKQAREWLLRLRSGDANEADARAFVIWCMQRPAHAQAARDAGRLWRRMQDATVAVTRQASAPGMPRRDRPVARRATLPRGRRAFMGAAVAAGASWLAVRPPLRMWPSVGDLAADYRTGTGEQRGFTPAAGLRVQMNTQTRIDVRTAGNPVGAIELLAGEAEIVAGLPVRENMQPKMDGDAFTIVAGNGRLRTRAARLNVRYTGPEVLVSCLEGLVELDHPQRRVMLPALHQLRYDGDAVQAPVPVDTTAVDAWRKGLLLFNDVPLAHVVEEINRYRPGKIFLRNAALGPVRVQAQFSIHKFDEALALIHELYGARITRLPGDIVLLS